MATKTLMTQIGEALATRLNTLANNLNAAAQEYADQKVAALVNSAPETLDTLGEIAAALQEHDDALDAINAAVAGHDHADATQTVHGFMSTADKKKLDNLGTYDDFVTAFDSIAG